MRRDVLLPSKMLDVCSFLQYEEVHFDSFDDDEVLLLASFG